MNAYSYFAQYYDLLTKNVEYGGRARYFHQIISRHLSPPAILLDLACGTGSLSLEFAALGYEVIGVDVSPEMLGVATEKSGAAGGGILFLCQDAARLDLYGTIDVCVCALDSINHFTGVKQLEQVFSRVALFTRPGGLFLFDVNTPYKHRHILADSCFVYDLDEVYCVWQNSYRPQNDTVDIALDFFMPTGGGAYLRREERFSERIFSQELLEGLLRQCGFEVLGLWGDDSFAPPQPDAQRLIYAARKIAQGKEHE